MDVRLSPEQVALRDAAAQMVDRLGPQSVGQLDDTERRDKLDAAVAAAGWRELRTATDDGSPLASGVEVGIVAEEMGRGLADTAFLGPTLAAELRRLAGAPPAPARETLVVLPDLSAPVHGTLPDGAVVDGAVAVDAAGAARALVLVPGRSGTQLGEVKLTKPAVGVDLTRPTASCATAVTLIDQSRLLTGDDLSRFLAFGLALTCADLVGVMRGAVALSVDYAGQRRQYDRAVGSFQAVQHLLADAHVATEGSRSVALHAAWAADALPTQDAAAAAAVAKAWCARAARNVCETAIQVHGGIGNTWECLAHVFLRRALASSDLFGGVGTNLGRVLDHHGIPGTGGA